MRIVVVSYSEWIFIILGLKKGGFLAKNGVKIWNFENSKKVPRDNLEIHVVSKFEVG